MIITLYLDRNIMNFRLPSTVSGSYTFDFEKNDGSLINVDSRDGKWILYQTDDVKILNANNEFIPAAELVSNCFYVVMRDGKRYLLYVYKANEVRMLAYNYSAKTNIVISNGDTNFSYKCSLLTGKSVTLTVSETGINLSNPNGLSLYVNKLRIPNSSYTLRVGDSLEIYGLRLIFLKEIILVNHLGDKLIVNNVTAGVDPFIFPNNEEAKNIEVKNLDLYKKDDYYQKSPRIRRIIEPKAINIATPAPDNSNEELPAILTFGPMLTMAITSVTMLLNTFIKVSNGETTFAQSWPQLVTGIIMLISTLFWPLVTSAYNKHAAKKRENRYHNKFLRYLNEKKKQLAEESKEQKIILYENLLTIENCLDILRRRNINFWDKRIDQNDFLTVRIGVGNEKLAVSVNYSEEEFTMEDSFLRNEVEAMIKEYEYIENVPIGYSFFENVITDIMGQDFLSINFMNNIILQLITFYSYEDLKIAMFTDENRAKNWEYIKFLNHNFTNQKDFRFFSTSMEDSKVINDFFEYEASNRLNTEQEEYKPHYLIIVDGYDNAKHLSFIEKISEADHNIGFSIIILENKLSKLPSKCNNFIIIEQGESTILKNSYEKQEQSKFKPEIYPNIDMMGIAKSIANIPIEPSSSSAFYAMPDTINFLEMEGIGKVEQLNILNRWEVNDSTSSLRAEIGVDGGGDLIYLDLHEAYHGPHGLIAGMTGSGKSEFIITYILSMAINYSPDDVAFILIDYKGGGLTGAFENPVTGACLPHLAGTITNLDKGEIARALVSIQSEVERRQEMFNIARDALGESKIDIYKYQKFYHEGRIKEPIPHLFIICDEFAELKAQQPEFMDNLISIARIGRSLGVHLILATQKPSGVVNDQIWSNTRFRVCLKVQDESDSKEMLKRPEAASLKQAGRFYLQVGFDEYFILGQSGWAGAKYFPSDKIVREVDKSINFINNYGAFIKSIQASNNSARALKAQGEQLVSIMNAITEVASVTSKKARRLWLDNIPAVILGTALENKYNYVKNVDDMEVFLGEYDAPEKQVQDVVRYNFLKDGNTVIYGNNGLETEMLYNTLIYMSTKNYSPEDINFYIIDYGSESLGRFINLPHVGGVVFQEEAEEYSNLMKMIKEEIKERKNILASFGGSFTNYNKTAEKKLPIKVIIFNNYDSIYSAHEDLYDILPDLVRDSERYGIIFWLSGSNTNSINSKVSNLCHNTITFKLKDVTDYTMVYDKKLDNMPPEIEGRGVIKHDNLHYFQVASICDESDNLSEYLNNYVNEIASKYQSHAKKVPVLPEKIRLDNVKDYVQGLNKIPVGISKHELETIQYDYTAFTGNIISSNKLVNTKNFVASLALTFSYFKDMFYVVIDTAQTLDNLNLNNYISGNFDATLDSIISTVEGYKNSGANTQGIILINGFNKFYSKLTDNKKFEKLLSILKAYERISIIVVDGPNQLKQFSFEPWFTQNFSISDGIWIGKGLADQNIFRINTMNKEMTADYKNDMGFVLNEGTSTLTKFIDFVGKDEE